MSNESYCVCCMNTIPEGAVVCPWCQNNPADYKAQLHHLPPNSILYGKYLIGRVLGEGGFGITYLARDLNLDIRVAVKEYYPYGCVNRNHTYSEDITVSGNLSKEEFENGKRKLMGEARTLAIFSDLKGIVGVRDFFLFNNTAYIVMDYLEGITLKELLKTRGKIPFDEVVSLLMPVMEDLVKVHETGLIHRDISPDNIMILRDGTARLMDFGAARQSEGTDSKSLSIVLKPGYTPEEQYRSRGEQGPWTDVYAICATIYKAITGVLPDEALQRLVEDTLKTPSQLGVKLPREKEQALMKGLAVSHKDRYQNMAELAETLKSGEKTGQTQKSFSRETDETPSRKGAFFQKRKWDMVVGITAILVLCGVLTFAFFRGKKTGDSLEDFTIKVDGVDCKLPMSCPEFVEIWWGTWDSDSDDWLVESGDMEVIDIADDVDEANYAVVYNPDNKEQMASDCYVYRMGMGDDLATVHEILLPNGLMLGRSTIADIDSALGPPAVIDLGDSYISQTYKLEDGNWQFMVDNNTKILRHVEVEYKLGLYPEGYAPTAVTVSEGETEEEKKYTKPENLGDDLMSGVVEYDGDLYQLPCPVNAMIQNGWKIADNMEREYLTSENGVSLDLVRDGKRINLVVSNPDTQARYLENCFIVRMDTTDGALVLPGGIGIGMAESDFYRVVEQSGYSYEKSEDESNVYIYRDASSYDRAEVFIDDGGVVAFVSYRYSEFMSMDNDTSLPQKDASEQIVNSLEDLKITIDGTQYIFPVSWQKLVEMGWMMPDHGKEEEPVKLLRRRNDYNGNGNITGWMEYSYDSQGNVIKIVNYNSDGSINNWKEYSYDSQGNEIKNVDYDSDGSISNWKEYSYDSQGKKIKNVDYDSDGSIRNRQEYSYDSQEDQIKAINYNGDGSIVSWFEASSNFDSQGNMIKLVNYDSDGSINNWQEASYDSQKNVIKVINYNSDDSISNWQEASYDSQGNMIRYSEYNSDGSISDWWEASYDSQGNMIKSVDYNSDGSLRFWIEYIWGIDVTIDENAVQEDIAEEYRALVLEYDNEMSKCKQILENVYADIDWYDFDILETEKDNRDAFFQDFAEKHGYQLNEEYSDNWQDKSDFYSYITPVAGSAVYSELSTDFTDQSREGDWRNIWWKFGEESYFRESYNQGISLFQINWDNLPYWGKCASYDSIEDALIYIGLSNNSVDYIRNNGKYTTKYSSKGRYEYSVYKDGLMLRMEFEEDTDELAAIIISQDNVSYIPYIMIEIEAGYTRVTLKNYYN